MCNVSQPRILMAMARDGLLPPFFSDLNKQSQVPVKSTIVTGLVSAALAFFMDVSQLAGMVSRIICVVKCKRMLLIYIYSTNVYFACVLQVSVGTLLAFTIASISVLIVRYIPPVDISIDSEAMECGWSHLVTNVKDENKKPLLVKEDVSTDYPLLAKHLAIDNCELWFSFSI